MPSSLNRHWFLFSQPVLVYPMRSVAFDFMYMYVSARYGGLGAFIQMCISTL